MPLRKSPVRTTALLAAHRANVRKSTGPRTPMGTTRVSFNRFKHAGRRTRRVRRPVKGQWTKSNISSGGTPPGGLFVFEPKSPAT
jgi:hypothetical protein